MVYKAANDTYDNKVLLQELLLRLILLPSLGSIKELVAYTNRITSIITKSNINSVVCITLYSQVRVSLLTISTTYHYHHQYKDR